MVKLLPDGPIDTLDLRGALSSMPEQVAVSAAAGAVADLPAATELDHVVIVGPGGTTTAAELAAALVAPVSSLPVTLQPTGELSASVGSRSLVVVASVDDHPVALAAAERAAASRAHVVVVGAGDGRLVAIEGVAAAEVSPGSTIARAAVGAVAVRLLGIFEQLGLFAEVGELADAAVAQLERRRTELTADGGPAEVLARRIGRTLPLVYGSDPLAGVAARHWKQQCNLNAKTASFAAALPSLGWAELAGWGQHGDMTRQVFSLVTLRHAHEPAGTHAAMARVTALVDEVVHERHDVEAAGNGALAQQLDLIFQGDLMSWHLAQELEIDPGPTDASM